MDDIGSPDPLRIRDGSNAEHASLQCQADTFFSLIANNPFGVYLIDADFVLRVVSLGAQKVFANVHPLIGRNFSEVLRVIWPEAFATEAIGHFRNTLATGAPYEAPTTVETRADVPTTEAYDWRIERVTMPDGSFGVVCYFYDLTEREEWASRLAEREAQLRDLTVDLERRVRLRTSALNAAHERLTAEIERREATQAALVQSQKLEALGQLTSGIAHDFNNIMGAVLGGFSIIEKRTSDPHLIKVAGMGKSAAERGAALVRQLMAFARQEVAEPQRIAMAPALTEVIGLIQHGLNRNVALRVDCPDDAWPAFADPAQFQSALLNLAINANDAMPEGGELAIVVDNAADSRPEGRPTDHPPELAGRDAVRIVISDTGTGMAAPVLQRVLEPFFTTKDKGRGTGLGLAMVQGFVAEAGGAIRIHSRPGEGTTFAIYLPRGPADEPDSVRPGAEAAGADARRAFETVLIVDDDPDFLGVNAAGLADFGFDVISVETAQDALAMLQTRAIDVLLSDIDLPGMNGIELVAQLRRTGPAIPCLLITGGAGPAAPEGETVLLKPFTPAVLRDALHAQLSLRDRSEAEVERLDRLEARLKSDCTRSLLGHWRALKGQSRLPRIDQFDLDACTEPHRIVIAEVDLGRVPIDFRFTKVGNTAAGAIPGSVSVGDMPVAGNDSLAAREAAYRRCALTGSPSYEYARCVLDADEVETFERLLLPFSSDGQVVDRIVSAVVVDGAPPPKESLP